MLDLRAASGGFVIASPGGRTRTAVLSRAGSLEVCEVAVGGDARGDRAVLCSLREVVGDENLERAVADLFEPAFDQVGAASGGYGHVRDPDDALTRWPYRMRSPAPVAV